MTDDHQHEWTETTTFGDRASGQSTWTCLGCGSAEVRPLSGEFSPWVCSDHAPKQHRDGKPPWCPHCRLTADFKVPVSNLAAPPLDESMPTPQKVELLTLRAQTASVLAVCDEAESRSQGPAGIETTVIRAALDEAEAVVHRELFDSTPLAPDAARSKVAARSLNP